MSAAAGWKQCSRLWAQSSSMQESTRDSVSWSNCFVTLTLDKGVVHLVINYMLSLGRHSKSRKHWTNPFNNAITKPATKQFAKYLMFEWDCKSWLGTFFCYWIIKITSKWLTDIPWFGHLPQNELEHQCRKGTQFPLRLRHWITKRIFGIFFKFLIDLAPKIPWGIRSPRQGADSCYVFMCGIGSPIGQVFSSSNIIESPQM